MGQFDFTYTVPANFNNRVIQLLQQLYNKNDLVTAFRRCNYEYEDIGNAYYAGMRGDNWNKNALDFTIEGSNIDISILKKEKRILEEAISKALKPSESGFLLHSIVYLSLDGEELYPETNEKRLNADIIAAEAVLGDLIKIGERLCSNVTYNGNSSENSINDYFRDTLSFMGYAEIKDQTRHGISKNGKDAGEIDILINKDGKEIAIYEGLKLTSVNTSYIDDHIEKAITNYNALGTATFIVAYVKTSNYEAFWDRYITHLKDLKFTLEVKKELQILSHPNASTRVANMILSRDNFDFPVYFITFKLLDTPQ